MCDVMCAVVLLSVTFIGYFFPEPPEAGCSSGSASDTGPSSSRPAVEVGC